jgi:hypothetical protein
MSDDAVNNPEAARPKITFGGGRKPKIRPAKEPKPERQAPVKFGGRNRAAGKSARPAGALAMAAMFFGFVIAGTLVMWFVPDPIVHFILAIGLTVVYGLVGGVRGWHTGAFRDTFVDSCYYLGFVFTQLALVVTFMKAYYDGAENFDVGTFVSLIATALGASVVGLLWKFWYDQSSGSEAPNQDEIRESLVHLARSVKEETVKISQEVQAISASLQGASRELAAAVSDSGRDLHTAAQQFKGSIAAFHGLSDQAQVQHQRLGSMLGEMSLAVEQLRAAMDQAGKSAGASIGDLGSDLRQAITLMAQLKTVAFDIHKLGESAREVLQQSSEAHRAVQRSGQRFDERLNRDLEQLRQQLNGVSGQVNVTARDEVKRSVSGLVDALHESARELAVLIKNVQAEIDQASQADRP